MKSRSVSCSLLATGYWLMIRIPDWPARKSDPVTSHIAAETVQKTGKRSRNQGIALELVRRYPGRTACELSQLTDQMERHEMSRRLPEVAAQGLIHKGARRKSRATGNPAVTWHPVNPEPKEPTLF